ncbi:MAG: hypothetical protein IKC49_02100 [Clostridia bacterium]|nr:hypothetical protein [Clostridia bacterium]
MKEEKLTLETLHTKKAKELTIEEIKDYFSADRQAIGKMADTRCPEETVKMLERKIKTRQELLLFLEDQVQYLQDMKRFFEKDVAEENNI